MPSITPHKSKGRPRTFNREVALTRALGVFWQRGFGPASIAELCAVMDINPPSLYAAFGNKAQLFMAAVNYYEATYWDPTWAQMTAEANLERAIGEFFYTAATVLTSQDAPCGCIVVLGAANIAAEDVNVHEALKVLRRQGQNVFEERLRKGVEDGELSSFVSVEALAMTLNTLLHGMSVQARDGAKFDQLHGIAQCALGLITNNTQFV